MEEFNFRQQLFNTVHEEIETANAFNMQAGKSLRLAHNHLSTWTFAEKKRLNGFIDTGVMNGNAVELPEVKLAEVDWVKSGAVVGVKDQGHCGSCWSFSTTGAVEGSYQINGNPLTSFSEEQLVQCNKFNHGCNGGSMALAFMYLKKTSLNTEASYGYTSGGGDRGTCDTTKVGGPVKVLDFTQVP